MRWLFGSSGQKNGDISTNISSIPSTSASTPARRQNNENNLSKKRRSFAAFLRSSLKSNSKSVDIIGGGRKESSTFISSNIINKIRSTTHHLSPDRFCPSLSPAPSACHSEPASTSCAGGSDGQLDKSLMQICTDVKYENRRRPKFAAVGELREKTDLRHSSTTLVSRTCRIGQNMGAQIDTARSSFVSRVARNWRKYLFANFG